MGKLVDYKCEYAEYTGMTDSYVEALGLKLPDVYQNARDMAALSKAVKEEKGYFFCKLPFDTAVEAENLGAQLKYDHSPLGPRKDHDTVEDPEDVLKLPRLDPGKGRLAEILKACDCLHAEGEKVALEIRGLFDVLNALLDIQKVMMLSAMKPDVMQQICDKIRDDLIVYVDEAQKHCDIIYYSDASGGLNVVGPRYGKKVVKWFTYPLMKGISETLEEGTIVQMCPKAAFMLTGCDKAEWKRLAVEDGIYGEMVLTLPKEVQFLGQKCNRRMGDPVKKHIDYLALK